MRRSPLSIAIGLALLATATVQAQTAQTYVGGGLGMGSISVDCEGLNRCDKSSTGGKFHLGHRAANQWAFELTYLDWGKVRAQSTEIVSPPASGQAVALGAGPVTVTVDGELRASGFGVGVAYFMPLATDWNAVLRLGVMRPEGKITGTGSAQGITLSESASKRSTQAYFGLGVGYNLTPALALTGEADFSRVKYGLEGEYETDPVRLISVGLRYSF
jgi:OOP family OmpA-OmpF porin